MFFFSVQPSFHMTAMIVVIAKKDSSAIIACVQTTLPSPPLWPLWSLKHFMMAKEPFNKDFSFLSPKSLNLKSYMHVVVCECDDFLVACYVLTKGPKANQNPSLTCCSNLWGKANQIIFHTFWEKSRGLHTRLATVNHRHPFSDFPFYHCNHYNYCLRVVAVITKPFSRGHSDCSNHMNLFHFAFILL